ncbi:MAG: hypothetical protein ACRDJE_19710 [Dehalococcoidia bacterium]
MTSRKQATQHDEQAAEERARAKFQVFYEALPAEEQQALDAGIARALAGGGGEDISGYGFGTSPIPILAMWEARIAPASAPKRLDQEMDHGIAAKCTTGKHYPEVTIE